MTKSPSPDSAPPFTTFVLLAAVYIATWLNSIYFAGTTGVSVRFTFPLLNYLFFIAVQLIPFKLFAIAMTDFVGWRRIVISAIVVPLAIVAVPSACAASACVVMLHGMIPSDASFERLHAFDAPGGSIAIYRTNGGATTAFGIVAMQECPIIPGLVLAHPLLHEYPADEADVVIRSSDSVRFSISGEERKGLPSTLHFDVPICKFGCLCPPPNPVPIEQIPK